MYDLTNRMIIKEFATVIIPGVYKGKEFNKLSYNNKCNSILLLVDYTQMLVDNDEITTRQKELVERDWLSLTTNLLD